MLASIYKILREMRGKASWRRWHLSRAWNDVQGFFGWHGAGITKGRLFQAGKEQLQA